LPSPFLLRRKIVLKKKFEAEYGREEKLDNSNP
jgi:hypothetical protein